MSNYDDDPHMIEGIAERRAMQSRRSQGPIRRTGHPLYADKHHNKLGPKYLSQRRTRSTGSVYNPHRRGTEQDAPIQTRFGMRKRLFGRLLKRWHQGFSNSRGGVYGKGRPGSKSAQGEVHRIRPTRVIKKRTQYRGSTKSSANNVQRRNIHQHVKKKFMREGKLDPKQILKDWDKPSQHPSYDEKKKKRKPTTNTHKTEKQKISGTNKDEIGVRDATLQERIIERIRVRNNK